MYLYPTNCMQHVLRCQLPREAIWPRTQDARKPFGARGSIRLAARCGSLQRSPGGGQSAPPQEPHSPLSAVWASSLLCALQCLDPRLIQAGDAPVPRCRHRAQLCFSVIRALLSTQVIDWKVSSAKRPMSLMCWRGRQNSNRTNSNQLAEHNQRLSAAWSRAERRK